MTRVQSYAVCKPFLRPRHGSMTRFFPPSLSLFIPFVLIFTFVPPSAASEGIGQSGGQHQPHPITGLLPALRASSSSSSIVSVGLYADEVDDGIYRNPDAILILSCDPSSPRPPVSSRGQVDENDGENILTPSPIFNRTRKNRGPLSRHVHAYGSGVLGCYTGFGSDVSHISSSAAAFVSHRDAGIGLSTACGQVATFLEDKMAFRTLVNSARPFAVQALIIGPATNTGDGVRGRGVLQIDPMGCVTSCLYGIGAIGRHHSKLRKRLIKSFGRRKGGTVEQSMSDGKLAKALSSILGILLPDDDDLENQIEVRAWCVVGKTRGRDAALSLFESDSDRDSAMISSMSKELREGTYELDERWVRHEVYATRKKNREKGNEQEMKKA